MTTFRIRAEFDLIVSDHAEAKEAARQFMIERVDEATMKGQQIQSTSVTPSDAFDALLDSPEALASLMATSMITSGAAGTPSVKCTNLDLKHITD